MRARIRTAERGMTLIELMVALTIGLFLALAVTTVISVTLRQQKTSASVNERDQAATYAMAQLDKYIRSAGSGFANASAGSGVIGCTVKATQAGVALFPASLSAPFDGVSAFKNPVAAPLLIEKGVGANGSDVLFVMSSHGLAADVPRYIVSKASTPPAIGLYNMVDLALQDLVLVASTGSPNCYVSQIVSWVEDTSTVTLGGRYPADAAALQTVVAADPAYLVSLGNSAGGYPVMKLIGVGSDDSLYQYDLLHTSSDKAQSIAEDVSHLFALYGVDTDNDGKVDAWVDPGNASWTPSALKASTDKLSQILAIRLAIVTHSHGVKQANVSPEKLVVFKDLGTSLQREVTLTAEQRNARYRVTESIVPLRNNLQLIQ